MEEMRTRLIVGSLFYDDFSVTGLYTVDDMGISEG
jgi:hypothetical protein